MIIANKPLNIQALILEEAENDIRIAVMQGYYKGFNKSIIAIAVKKIIQEAVSKIRIKNLKESAIVSLINFFNRQYTEISRVPLTTLLILSALNKLSIGKELPLQSEITALKSQGMPTTANSIVKQYGVPMQKFSQKYFKDNVKPIFDNLIRQQAIDPNDLRSKNTLRNLAEMEVRYNDHLEQIQGFKSSGIKLVIASTHADCSERCAKWQGRVYSLDGTYGKTDDGREYIPLEVATNVPYTTKSGKTYMNGLLGFNCRHFLVPYKKGFYFPKPNAKEERKEYAITLKQRALEREVRKWKTTAIANKNTGGEVYLTARKNAIEWNKKYIKFSRDNNRAYYPSRTKII